MDDTTYIGGEEPKKKRSRVKWFSFIFAGALIFLGIKIFVFTDPRLSAAQMSVLRHVSWVAFGLGALALVVGIFGSIVKAPWVKLLDLVEAFAFVGAASFILATRGNLFGPLLPIVLIVIGLIKGIIAVREYRKLHAR